MQATKHVVTATNRMYHLGKYGIIVNCQRGFGKNVYVKPNLHQVCKRSSNGNMVQKTCLFLRAIVRHVSYDDCLVFDLLM